eukprot:TRINITY_DN1211_c0_g1_i10.p1 TRINITY_DN1211_c0_g1~~TRINITY_DN1211_c0_g1_i10.p1  ORF type:complete len:157 (+),score=26.02 TRINITY_DN1211_c0_g1_i10:242-712(+)
MIMIRIPWLDIREAVTQQLDRELVQCFLVQRVEKAISPSFVGFGLLLNYRFRVVTWKQQEIYNRMPSRQHFMPISLLDSQLAILEEPEDDERIIMCDVDRFCRRNCWASSVQVLMIGFFLHFLGKRKGACTVVSLPTLVSVFRHFDELKEQACVIP